MGGSPGDVSENPVMWEKRKKGWRMSYDVTYVTAHSSTLSSLYLHYNSFSVASPTSQLILQPFFRFSHITGFSLISAGEPPMVCRYEKED